MRRKDRMISIEECIDIINKSDVCKISICENNIPYIVPLNFGYTYIENMLTLYFHSAMEGKKIDIIKNNNNISFLMDCSHKLILAENACEMTMEFESVIGSGKIYFVDDLNEKRKALEIIVNNYLLEKKEKVDINFDLNKVAILKLVVDEFCGKRLKK